MLSIGGCGQSGSPSDQTEGLKALQTALDAGENGKKQDTLQQSTPPIYVTDGDWMTGLRLQTYTIEGEGKLISSDVNYKVSLEMKTANGEIVECDAV